MKTRKISKNTARDARLLEVPTATIGGKFDPVDDLLNKEDPSIHEIMAIRLLEFPFFYVGTEPVPIENRGLLAALKQLVKRKRVDDYQMIVDFVTENPHSSWNASLFANLGYEYFRVGRFSDSISFLEKAWNIIENEENEVTYEIANHVLAELARMYARLGNMEALTPLLAAADRRNVNGSSRELLAGAREGLWLMRTRPQDAFKCGIYALANIFKIRQQSGEEYEKIHTAASGVNGFSLVQLREFSRELGLDYQMAKREEGAAIIVPAVIHLGLNHYGALTKSAGDNYKLQDPTFGGSYEALISKETVEKESSGYFLVPAGKLPRGWAVVDQEEGAKVWGKGNTGDVDKDRNTAYDDKALDKDCQKGLASYNVHLLKVNLLIQDIPIGYTPPRGLPIYTRISYNHREANQPAIMDYSNLSSRWTLNWISFIKDKGPTLLDIFEKRREKPDFCVFSRHKNLCFSRTYANLAPCMILTA